ncbi:PorT family protein [Flaviramulus sp. BrNp1-15]|uniref:PorT family protein n=1 Tax=Flaviramulus sp. BrNp1-15 TaxID=2916754 RepID=UPI001EE8052D|nr:PorT family protein [Flaviramulus sp. BrNp1-15]ULC59997.1 PorT family protein [Flaviramulus sp. BrNp1-15]
MAKKQIYIIVILLFFSIRNVSGQIDLKIGANIGGQVSSLRGLEYETENKFELVPMIGLNLEVSFSPSVSIVTGINFERWKKKRDFALFDPFAVPEGETSYIEGYDFYNVPFLVRYKFGSKKDFFIDAGGFMNYFNKGRPNRRYSSLFIQFEDYNFGAVFGVGKTFNITDKINIDLQLRDELGLTDVNKYEWEIRGEVMTNTIRMIATVSYEL